MATGAPCVLAGDDAEARIKLTCIHGGRLVRCGPGGASRYVGGETRVLAVPRAATFRGLAARLSSEVAGGAEVRAVRHRLADDEDVLVSVTCDDELAHMIDEYDRLRATRPSAAFRVFVSTDSDSGGVQQRRGPASVDATRAERAGARRSRPAAPAPMRRVQSTQELAAAKASRLQHFFRHGCRYVCHRRTQCAAVAASSWPVYAPPYMSKNVSAGGASVVSTAVKAEPRTIDAKAAMEMEKRRAIREFTRQNVTLL